MDTAQLVTISMDGAGRSATFSAGHHLAGYPRGDDGWSDLGYHIPDDCPIIRFDRAADQRAAITFSVTGPMPNPDLPPQTVSHCLGNLVEGVTITTTGPSEPIRSLDYASLDVYLALAAAAGIPVETYATRSEITR